MGRRKRSVVANRIIAFIMSAVMVMSPAVPVFGGTDTISVNSVQHDSDTQSFLDGYVSDEPKYTSPHSRFMRYQGLSGICDLFSAIVCIENNLLKKGYIFDGKVPTEDELYIEDWYTANVMGVVLKTTDFYRIAETFLSWNGLTTHDNFQATRLEQEDAALVHLSGAYMEDIEIKNYQLTVASLTRLKSLIKKYGAVAVTNHFNKDCFQTDSAGNHTYCATYDDIDFESHVGHTVAFIGWDDNYSRENFPEDRRPLYDGAFLAKNSNSKDSGYLWVAYENMDFIPTVNFYEVEPHDKEDHVYHDGEASVSALGPSPAVYTQNNAEKKPELLDAVTVFYKLYGDEQPGPITVKVYKYFDKNYENGELVVEETYELEHEGFSKVTLSNPVKVLYGEKFLVRVEGDGGYNHARYVYAYTKDMPDESSDGYLVCDTDSVTIDSDDNSATIEASAGGGAEITYTSGNTKIVTVNEDGVLTPVTGGTTYVTLTTEQGGYKKVPVTVYRDFEGAQIVFDCTSYPFETSWDSGTEKYVPVKRRPGFKMYMNGYQIYEDDGWHVAQSVVYADNYMPGRASVTVDGSFWTYYTGKKTAAFEIRKAKLSETLIPRRSQLGLVYRPDGAYDFSRLFDSLYKTGEEHFSAKIEPNRNAVGDHTVVCSVTGSDYYEDSSVSRTEHISPMKPSSSDISISFASSENDSRRVEGKPKYFYQHSKDEAYVPKTEVCLSYGGKTYSLAEGKDYSISVENDVAVRNQRNVIITMCGNYEGKFGSYYYLAGLDPLLDFENATVEPAVYEMERTFDGTVPELSPKVTFNGKVLAAGKDYTVRWDEDYSRYLGMSDAPVYDSDGYYAYIVKPSIEGVTGSKYMYVRFTRRSLSSDGIEFAPSGNTIDTEDVRWESFKAGTYTYAYGTYGQLIADGVEYTRKDKPVLKYISDDGRTVRCMLEALEGKGDFTGSMEVSIDLKEKEVVRKKYTVYHNAPQTGDVIINGARSYGAAYPGDMVSFVAAPYTGYHTDSVSVIDLLTGEEVELTLDNGTYSFVMPERNVRIIVLFEKDEEVHEDTIHHVNMASVNMDIHISPLNARKGETVTVIVDPMGNEDDYMYIDSMAVVLRSDGVTEIPFSSGGIAPDGKSAEFTFIMPDGDVTITGTRHTVSRYYAVDQSGDDIDLSVSPFRPYGGDTVHVTAAVPEGSDEGCVIEEVRAYMIWDESVAVPLSGNIAPDGKSAEFTFVMPEGSVGVCGKTVVKDTGDSGEPGDGDEGDDTPEEPEKPEKPAEEIVREEKVYTVNAVVGGTVTIPELKKVREDKKIYKLTQSVKKIASLSTAGKIKGLRAGDTVFTLVKADGTYTINIHVDAPSLAVKKVILYKGETAAFGLSGTKLMPAYRSTKAAVAGVSDNGEITAISYGTAKVYGTIEGKKYTVSVYVYDPYIAGKDTVKPRKKITLSVKKGVPKSKWVWKSSDESVATVSTRGVVKGISSGTAVISATLGDRVIEKTVTVMTP